MLRKLFRRPFGRGSAGPHKPPPFVQALIDALPAAGLTVAFDPPLTDGDKDAASPHAPETASEHALARPPGTRSRGLIRIENGPPDLINSTSVGVGRGHLSRGDSTGFHWLIRPHRLATPWPGARVDAKREFSARDVGPARRFRWTPLDDTPASRAAAALLQERGNELALNDRVLRLLQQPELLSLELAPEKDGWLRWSVFLGYERTLTPDEIATLRDLCRLVATPCSEAAAPAS